MRTCAPTFTSIPPVLIAGCVTRLELPEVFRRVLAVVGPSRLLFGTDSSFFPRGWNREIFQAQTTALQQIGVTAADARLILGENLERLVGR